VNNNIDGGVIQKNTNNERKVHCNEENEPWIERGDLLDDRYRRLCGYRELVAWLGRVENFEMKERVGSLWKLDRLIDLRENEEEDEDYGWY
jgi:hypothetical protein